MPSPTIVLVLIDDNITSGSQALCQMLAWAGVPEASWTPEQRLERGIERTPLSDRDLTALKSLRLSIVTGIGTNAADEHLRSELPSIGIHKFEGVLFGEDMGTHISISANLQTYLQDVGRSVLAWARHEERDPAKTAALLDCQRDALGYRAAKALICTPVNVPVGTFTAIWCPGFYEGEVWTPLLIRRGYLDKLVLA